MNYDIHSNNSRHITRMARTPITTTLTTATKYLRRPPSTPFLYHRTGQGASRPSSQPPLWSQHLLLRYSEVDLIGYQTVIKVRFVIITYFEVLFHR